MKEHLEHPSIHDKALVQGELQLFRSLWKNSSDNLFIVRRDEQGIYISEKSNTSMEQTFHIEPNQLDGVCLKDILEPEVYQKIAQRYDDCIQSGQPLNYEEGHQIDDSGLRYWDTMILPVVDPATGLARIFGISREITTLKRAESVLKQTNEYLEAEVAKRTQELSDALKEMEKISIQDKLTGLYNRHKLDEALSNKKQTAESQGNSFGVVLLDLDNFKTINDRLGHHYGDRALQELAQVLKTHSKETDVVGRWGGDEFIIISSESRQDSLLAFAKHLKSAIENHEFEHFDQLTSSMGIALFQPGETVDALIHRADQGLYQSKSLGKNRVLYLEKRLNG